MGPLVLYGHNRRAVDVRSTLCVHVMEVGLGKKGGGGQNTLGWKIFVDPSKTALTTTIAAADDIKSRHLFGV